MTRILMACALTIMSAPATLHASSPDQVSDAAALVSACEGNDAWDAPAPPARIAANVWYVGTCGISAILIKGSAGNVLIDGGVAKAAPLVLANIRKAGFNPSSVRWIAASHSHFDHAGALASLKAATGARVVALSAQKAVLEDGRPSKEDPQAAQLGPIAPVKVDHVLSDGGVLRLGNLAITAHATPVHAPESTSWTWQSCYTALRCVNVAYVDSASTISAKGYRFSDNPERLKAISAGLSVMAALPCDILLTPHPGQSDMMDRFAGKKAWIDPGACHAYVKDARERLSQRLAEEQAR